MSDANSEELYTIIDRAIDEAMFNGRFLLLSLIHI